MNFYKIFIEVGTSKPLPPSTIANSRHKLRSLGRLFFSTILQYLICTVFLYFSYPSRSHCQSYGSQYLLWCIYFSILHITNYILQQLQLLIVNAVRYRCISVSVYYFVRFAVVRSRTRKSNIKMSFDY